MGFHQINMSISFDLTCTMNSLSSFPVSVIAITELSKPRKGATISKMQPYTATFLLHQFPYFVSVTELPCSLLLVHITTCICHIIYNQNSIGICTISLLTVSNNMALLLYGNSLNAQGIHVPSWHSPWASSGPMVVPATLASPYCRNTPQVIPAPMASIMVSTSYVSIIWYSYC